MKKFLILLTLSLTGCEGIGDYKPSSATSEMYARMSSGERFDQAVGIAKGTEQGRPSIETLGTSMTCFSEGEEISGFNKICYYDCLGELSAVNLPSISLCPVTIKR